MIKDYQTKQGRLTKKPKYYNFFDAHFNLDKNINLTDIFNFAFATVLIVLAIDFVGMVAWSISGQFPLDGFYVGRISTEIIRLFI
jgi:hypothetical protein